MEQKLSSEDMDKLPKVPLNDDAVWALIKDNKLELTGYADLAIKLVRAVEKAHGIV